MCVCVCVCVCVCGATGGVMFSKLDDQTFSGEFESYWMPLSYGYAPYLNKKLSKLYV